MQACCPRMQSCSVTRSAARPSLRAAAPPRRGPAAQGSEGYRELGPIPWPLPPATGLKGDCSLFFTLPQQPPPPPGGQGFPVVILYSGFLASARWYRAIAQRMAAAGYAVVQYDPPEAWPYRLTGVTLPLTGTPEQEVPVFDALLTRLEQENQSGSAAKGALDLGRLYLAGHSRGGAISALVQAKAPASGPGRVAATVLLDPVDMTTAGETLRNAPASVHERVRIVPADTTGLFNPIGLNYKRFFTPGDGTDLAYSGTLPVRCKLTHILFFDAGNDGGSLGLPLNDIADVLDLFSLPIVGPLATAAAAAAAGMPQPMAADGLRLLEAQCAAAGPEATLLELARQVFPPPAGAPPPGDGAPLAAPGGAPSMGGLSQQAKEGLRPLAAALRAALDQGPIVGGPAAGPGTLSPLVRVALQLLRQAFRWVRGIQRANAARFSADKMQEWFGRHPGGK